MTFSITINLYGKHYKMQVEQIYSGASIEKFRISGGSRSIVLQSNRPELDAKKSKKPIEWKILEGDIHASDKKNTAIGLLLIIKQIEQYLQIKNM